MSIQQIIPSLIATLALVLATGCGVEEDDNTVAVHSIHLENGDKAPQFECIALAREIAFDADTRLMAPTVHPAAGLTQKHVLADSKCVETPIELHPSIRGTQDIAIIPRSSVTGPIEIHDDIVEPTEVVWMVATEDGTHLLPAILSERIEEIVVLVPRLPNTPYAVVRAHEVIDLIEIESFNPNPGQFEVVSPFVLDGTVMDTDEDTTEDDTDESDDEEV